MVWAVLGEWPNSFEDNPISTPGASPGVCLFLCRGDAERKPTAEADPGPSFPASPLIQDDSLLRCDFARRGFFCASGLRKSGPQGLKPSHFRN